LPSVATSRAGGPPDIEAKLPKNSAIAGDLVFKLSASIIVGESSGVLAVCLVTVVLEFPVPAVAVEVPA
jgi:hypothetical protein